MNPNTVKLTAQQKKAALILSEIGEFAIRDHIRDHVKLATTYASMGQFHTSAAIFERLSASIKDYANNVDAVARIVIEAARQ